MSKLSFKGGILLTLFSINGCTPYGVQTLENLPLPAQQSINCCWQAIQQLDINYNNQHYRLTGVLAQTPQSATLVILDPFGRRIISLSKQDDQIQIHRATELPSNLPERFLLASSMLVWWPFADWQQSLTSTSGWRVTLKETTRVLSYRGRTILSATYPTGSTSLLAGMSSTSELTQQPVVVRHHQHPLHIRVITSSRSQL